MAPSKGPSKLVLVYHRESGEVEVRRVDEWGKRLKSEKTPPSRLHYSGRDCSYVCRCEHSTRHKQSIPLAFDLAHVQKDMIRYLDRQNIESCSMHEFSAYQRQRRDDWSRAGIRIKEFHYTTVQKDVVCRCKTPHRRGQKIVRNSRIAELCADFFVTNKDKVTCSKAQWRAADTASHRHKASGRNPLAEKSSLRRVLSDCDSFPTAEYTHARTNRAAKTASIITSPKPEMCWNQLATNETDHMRNQRSGELDIPQEVWIKARPSAWNNRRSFETSTSNSTPLGTAATLHFPAAQVPSFKMRTVRPAPDAYSSHWNSVVITNWSNRAQLEATNKSNETPPAPRTASLAPPRTDDSVLHSLRSSPLPGHSLSDYSPQRAYRHVSHHSLYPDGLQVCPMVPSYTAHNSNPETRFSPVYELPTHNAPAGPTLCRHGAELFGDFAPEIDSHASSLPKPGRTTAGCSSAERERKTLVL